MEDKIILKQKILDYALSLGITEVGIAGDNATYSAIVCLFPYFTGYINNANLSLYTYSEDYHTISKNYLLKICNFTKELSLSSSFSIHVDKHGGDDRKYAYNAGLGFFGKNGLIINDRYGSYVFIGYILTDLLLLPDKPLQKECLSCGKCIAACPGKALGNFFDSSKCASAISQKKGTLSSTEEEILLKSGLIFGCDICQKVCPHNLFVQKTNIPEFYQSLMPSLTLSDIESFSERTFRKKFVNRAFSWRGRKILKRNLELFERIKKLDKDKL